MTFTWRARAHARASAWSDGGKPVSAPARSKATTLSSVARRRSASWATSSERCSVRIALKIANTAIGRPAAAAAASPRRNPAVTASTTASMASPPATCSSGAKRTSAYTTPSAARSTAAS